MIEIQAPDTFANVKKFTSNIANVDTIINKSEKSLQIKSKISRSKRQKTAKDLL